MACESFASGHPDSILAQSMDDGVDWRLANYVVPLVVTAGGVVFWCTTQWTIFGLSAAWWFGSQRHWVTTALAGLAAGHYIQEVFANRWSGHALLAHHLGAVLHALCLVRVNAWRGMLMGWSAVYEMGSLLLNFGYVGLIPRSLGHSIAAATTCVGMGLGLHSLARHRPHMGLNAPARFCVTALLCIGVGRI